MNARLFQLRPTTKGRNEFLTKKKCYIHKPVKHVQHPIASFVKQVLTPSQIVLHFMVGNLVLLHPATNKTRIEKEGH